MNDRVKILEPALWLDVYRILPALLRLRGANPVGEGIQRRVALRFAEVLRRFDADDALAVLDNLPEDPHPVAGREPSGPRPFSSDPELPLLQPAVVRAHALLEKGKQAEASLLLPDAPSRWGVRDLLLGRLHFGSGDLDLAMEHLTAAFDAAHATPDPLAREVEAEALRLRAQLRLIRREQELSDWDRLEALCEQHRAHLSRMAVQIFREAQARGKVAQLADTMVAVARRHEEGQYTAPVEHERDQVAPVPLHVHGAARKHAQDPEGYLEAILRLSALAWRVGDRLDGYETAVYGLRVGERLFGEAVAAPLRQFLDELLAPLDPDTRGKLERAAQERAREAMAQRTSR